MEFLNGFILGILIGMIIGLISWVIIYNVEILPYIKQAKEKREERIRRRFAL